MEQSTFAEGLHVAVIMDGNGRWARARGLPRTAGHRAGARAVRRVVEGAPGLGVTILTLYAFSSDNWGRPADEVSALMRLLRAYLIRETARLIENGVRLRIIGRRDRLPAALVRAIEGAEDATAHGDRLELRVAVDYSARDLLVHAASLARADATLDRVTLARRLGEAMHGGAPARDVDLLMRTGGEQRLSDFLLWECAYAELHFTPRLWPDVRVGDLAAALHDFRRRERRFGHLPDAAAG